jgi:hypothetical protein
MSFQDGFIHFHLLKKNFQTTQLQYINSHMFLNNRCVLQKQDIDCKIADTLLKKGTKEHTDSWDTSRKDLTHMVLHLPHPEGGYGVTLMMLLKTWHIGFSLYRFIQLINIDCLFGCVSSPILVVPLYVSHVIFHLTKRYMMGVHV